MLQEKTDIHLQYIHVGMIKIQCSIHRNGNLLFSETKDNLKRIFHLCTLIMK